jgi:hypothetical protein
MTPPAPHFRRVAATPLDVDDEEILKLSDDLGIPALTKPESKVADVPAPTTPIESQKQPKERISASAAPTPAAAPKKRTTSQNSVPAVDPVAERTRRIAIDIPDSLAEQLRRRAFEDRSTARHLILCGLKAIGFDVPESELVPDARRAEYKNLN